MKSSGKPMDIIAKLNEMAGYAPDEEIELFEVNQFTSHLIYRPLREREVLTFCFYTFRKLNMNLMLCANMSTRRPHSVPVRYIWQ